MKQELNTEMYSQCWAEPGWFTSLWWSDVVRDIINDQFEVIQQKQVDACGGGHTCAICKENTDDALSRRNKRLEHAMAKL